MLRSNNNRNFVSSSNIETNNVENFLEWTRTDVYNFPRKIGTTSSSDRLLSPAEEGKIRRTGNRLTSNNRPGYPFQHFNRCKNDSWTRGKDARDSRKFQGVDITVWNLLLAEIWEYVLTDLIVKIIVIKSGPLKIIRYTEIALKNWPNFENYCLPQNSCKILSKWIQFWIEKSFLESTNVSKFCSNENRFPSLQKFPPSIQLGKATCSNQTKPHLLSKHRIQKAFSKDQCVTSSLLSPSFVRISRKWSPPIASIITGFILGRLVQPFPPLRPRDE